MKKETQKKLLNRISRIEGQVRGLKKMVDENKYCIDVITQTSATRNAISALEDEILKNHLSTCAKRQIRGKEAKRATDEILKVYRLAKKK